MRTTRCEPHGAIQSAQSTGRSEAPESIRLYRVYKNTKVLKWWLLSDSPTSKACRTAVRAVFSNVSLAKMAEESDSESEQPLEHFSERKVFRSSCLICCFSSKHFSPVQRVKPSQLLLLIKQSIFAWKYSRNMVVRCNDVWFKTWTSSPR